MSNQEIAQTKSLLLDIDGMKCGGCVQAIEQILLKDSNVQSASVNLVTKTAWLELKNPDKSIEDLIKTLSGRGFITTRRIDRNNLKKSDSEIFAQKNWWLRWRQLMVALSLLLLSVLGHLVEGQQLNLPILGSLPFHAGLATYALAGPGRPILKRGLQSALLFNPTMDTLVGLGVTSAYLASLVALIWPQVGWPCFFNEPVMLLGFVLLGRFLEERARFRTGKALQELAQLQPESARLLLANDEIKDVRVGALRPGEKIQLLAGDRIPVDGIVISGNSAVDISSLTGEALPIDASPGTELPSGSLNLEGTINIEVKNVGADTALARIIGLVEEAQARKAPIQGLANKVAGLFCYGVTTLALGTFVFWWKIGTNLWPQVLEVSSNTVFHSSHVHGNLINPNQSAIGLAFQLSIAVLVIACPCALGLATPTVITVATGEAAKKGWLFRGGDVIEMAAQIKQIIFDKTGTLTIGRPLVSKVCGTSKPDKLLELAASLEQNSHHPLANAIVQEAQIKNLNLKKTINSQTFPGQGLSGKLIGIEGVLRVGTPEWIHSEGAELPLNIKDELNNLNKEGQSIVAVALEKEFLGFILIDDRVKDDAEISLKRLREKNLNLYLFSGDRSVAVEKLGHQLGFPSHQLGWTMLPAEKLNKLKDLQKYGLVAMVGDGINDAPALAASDLGIAVGTGTQIAQESADLVLLGDRLESIPDALNLSQKAMNKIKQNLAWAFGYNLIALPIAAGLLLPGFGVILSPPIAALLMALSSITVVLNALSLKTT